MWKNAIKVSISMLLLLNAIILVASPSEIMTLASSEHDLEVYLEAPKELLLGHPGQLKANVTNMGSSDETNVTILLQIDGTTVASKTVDLSAGSSDTLSYTWTPIFESGQVELTKLIKEASFPHNITAYAPQVEGETSTENNAATKTIQVWNPTVYIDSPHVIKDLNENFTIEVRVANLTDKLIPHPNPERAAMGTNVRLGNLYGLDINLSWNPEILEYVSHVITIPVEDYPGGILHEPVQEVADNKTVGTYKISYASMHPAESFNNPGASSTVFNMTFKVIGKGGCLLRLLDTDLSTRIESLVEIWIPHARSDGLFETIGAPKAIFTHYPPDVAVANKTVTFNATESYDPDGNVTLYMWDFGDGTKENSPDPIITHDYTADGVYEIILTVLDNEETPSAPTIKSLRVVNLRDIALISVTPSTKIILQNLTLTIDATVKNEGEIAENFALSAYYNKTAVDTETLWEQIEDTKVLVDFTDEQRLTFYWNTTGVTPEAYYYIMVNASVVPHEENVTDNAQLCLEPVFITAQEIHDVVIKSIEIKVPVGPVEFNVPVISGENASIYVEVKANGSVPETFNVSLRVIAPNDTAVFNETWEGIDLDPGEDKKFPSSIFSTEDLATGNYTVRVNGTIIEEDNYPTDNFMEKMFRVIGSPVIVIAPLPDPVYVGDEIIFDATDSQHPNGEITVYTWNFYQAGSRRWIKYGPVVNATFDNPGPWTVVLTVKDNFGLQFSILRPQTKAYEKVLNLTVEGKGWGLPVEAIYAILGIVLAAIAGILAYLRLRKPKPEPT